MNSPISTPSTSSFGNMPSIVMLDNLDSFTYNLVDEFKCLGYEPTIYRNTLSAEFVIDKITQLNEENPAGVIIVLSPGPGDPTHAGCLMELITHCVGKYPILGICLGHQALIQHYGGVIGRAPTIVHGKSSNIVHDAKGCFNNIAMPLPVARYHSLVATTMPDTLEMIAYYDTTSEDTGEYTYRSTDKNNENYLSMAIQSSKDAVLGFQFHPESILTTYGSTLLAQGLTHLSELAQEQLSQKSIAPNQSSRND